MVELFLPGICGGGGIRKKRRRRRRRSRKRSRAIFDHSDGRLSVGGAGRCASPTCSWRSSALRGASTESFWAGSQWNSSAIGRRRRRRPDNRGPLPNWIFWTAAVIVRVDRRRQVIVVVAATAAVHRRIVGYEPVGVLVPGDQSAGAGFYGRIEHLK